MDNHVNPIKQGARVKQFIGWFIAILFPFTAIGIMNMTKIPLIAVLLYLGVCGVLLRLSIEKKLPYLNPQFSKVKKETGFLVIATIISSYICINGSNVSITINKDIILNILIFGVLSGIFEQLVWINIIELAGSRIKILGFVASCIYIILIEGYFWNSIINMPIASNALFILSQILMILISVFIYIKTQDLTIWSMQHIIYNIIIIICGNFGISALLHLH